jgi:hypothetical protein
MVLFTTSSDDWKDFFARAVEENTFVLESPLYLSTFSSMSSEMQGWTADRLVFRLHDPWNPESAIARRQLRALGYSPDSLWNVDADSLKYLIGQIPAASMPGPPLAQLSQVRYPYLGWRVVYRIGHYHFFPVVLLSYGGIVFFITLFLNFLLKGEPLSGWPGRRAT